MQRARASDDVPRSEAASGDEEDFSRSRGFRLANLIFVAIQMLISHIIMIK